MDREVGNPHFEFWLLGDSEPERWKNLLHGPLDPRHPIRHNIWTSVLDVIQDQVFRKAGLRFDTSQIYIRNAVRDVTDKPSSKAIKWPALTASTADASAGAAAEGLV
jgi:hypothetical protein